MQNVSHIIISISKQNLLRKHSKYFSSILYSVLPERQDSNLCFYLGMGFLLMVFQMHFFDIVSHIKIKFAWYSFFYLNFLNLIEKVFKSLNKQLSTV